MTMRLVALNTGPNIPINASMMVVGRHPTCDIVLDSNRISLRHCCMIEVRGELEIKDLGSTNGLRINGRRVDSGRLRIGDELTIAHIHYKLYDGREQEATVVASIGLERAERPEPSPARRVVARQSSGGGRDAQSFADSMLSDDLTPLLT